MIEEYYIFLFGVFLMSFGVSYAWWMKIRVMWFRQDIYDLRDELFMACVRLRCVDDEGGRAARDHLNVLAQVASVLSIPFLANAIQLGLAEVCAIPKSKNVELDKLIESAMNRADRRIGRYLLRESLTGLIIIPASRLMSMAWVEQKFIGWVHKWRASRAAEDAIRLLGRTGDRWAPS